MNTAKSCLITMFAILLCACASTKSTQTTDERSDAEKFDLASGEEMPKFRGGGLENFRIFIAERITYLSYLRPSRGVDMEFLFVIEENGRLGNIQIVRSSGNRELDNEMMRMLRSTPRWTPGRKDGEPVKVQFIMPIVFTM